MAPMRKPAPKLQEPWQDTCSVDTFAHEQGMTAREVREMLREQRLPFVEIDGQIRVPRSASISEPKTAD